jgi:hypothetical protein
MTKDMLDVVDVLNVDYMKEEFLFCHKHFLMAKEASKQFPAIAESGERVRHGATVQINVISDYWEIRRDLIKEFLPREWVEEQGVNSCVYRR